MIDPFKSIIMTPLKKPFSGEKRGVFLCVREAHTQDTVSLFLRLPFFRAVIITGNQQ